MDIDTQRWGLESEPFQLRGDSSNLNPNEEISV